MPRSLPPALNVRWSDTRLVGKVITPGPTHFGYAPDWLTSGYNLSPLAVPFTDILFRQRAPGFDHLPGFLADCLPDQWGRRLMEREFREKDITATPMRMLAWVGRRGMGALQFEPALEEDRSASSWEEVKPILLTREAQAVMRNAPASSFRHLMGAGTAGGALPKATVALLRDGTLLSGGNVADRFREPGRLGLLKLDSEDDPLGMSTDGRFEHAYLKMAHAAGINTVKSKVIPETGGTRPRYHLFVERFDVRSRPGLRLHVLTLAGALHRYDLTYGDLLQTVRTLTADHNEVLEAVRRMCFNVRAGNADDHGKNHSFIFDDTTGRWTLSPAYDLTLNYSTEGNARGLFPRSFGASPRRQLLLDTAADAGVSADEFDRIDAEVTQAVAVWPEYAERVSLPLELVNKARTIQQGLAVSLTVESAARSKRRKRW
jgi:serine/threonine-protein kinase HipA